MKKSMMRLQNSKFRGMHAFKSNLKDTNYHNPINSNEYISELPNDVHHEKRPIIIDGLNVGHAHGKEISPDKNLKTFSATGLQITVDYFKNRGHKTIIIWLPRIHQKYNDYWNNKAILNKLEEEGHIKWTMVRILSCGKIIASYDDRSIGKSNFQFKISSLDGNHLKIS